MKRFLVLWSSLMFTTASYADTETINWYVDGNTYTQTTCQTGGDVILPTPPTKRGYVFKGWHENYIPVEYLESSGTQYIDTDFIPQIGTKLQIRVTLLSGCTTTSSSQNFAGTTARGALTYFAPLARSVGASQCYYYFNSYNATSICDINDTITASIEIGATGATIQQNNETKNTINNYTKSGVFEPALSIYLFAGHVTSGQGVAEKACARMYYAKIWDNGVLVHDFVPVLDSSKRPAMYDKVERKFYYNIGTGDFSAGPAIY